MAALPFLFTPIPPLIDVPGHIGRFAVQTAPSGGPLDQYFDFHWALTLNLASDLVVQLLQPVMDVFASVWLVCASTAVLTCAGTLWVARALNPRGGTTLPWALLFVFNSPFLWGFLNFGLATALALLALAAWVLLAGRPRRRSALFLAIAPLVLIGHGVSGILLIAMIAGYEGWRLSSWHPGRWTRRELTRIAALWSPLLGGAVTLAVWKWVGAPGGGATRWLLYRKGEALVTMLRDQNVVLDIGSVIACATVWLVGRYWGARLPGGSAGPVVAAAVLFVATPSLISGSDRIDTRLAPYVALLALVLQDWSAVEVRKRRVVAWAGSILLVTRLAITTVGFIGYDRHYAEELTALEQVRDGSRVLNLTLVDCGIEGWRGARLDHLANLATPLRHAWVNAHWSIDGLQLLRVRYRPSPDYHRDPSHLIWPEQCIDRREPFARRDRHGLLESMRLLPIDRVDYLWLIGVRLPASHADPRLRRIWARRSSELYVVRRPSG